MIILKNFEQKCYFPYSFLDSFEKFDGPFPEYGSSWTNSLTVNVDITEEQKEKAKKNIRFDGVQKLW